jgi:hypothetical protein
MYSTVLLMASLVTFGIFKEEPLLYIQTDQGYRKLLLYPAMAILLFIYYEYGTTRRGERESLKME